MSQITLISESNVDNHAATKNYSDSLSENERNRHGLSIVINDQGNEFDKTKFSNLGSIMLSRKPFSDDEAFKKWWRWLRRRG